MGQEKGGKGKSEKGKGEKGKGAKGKGEKGKAQARTPLDEADMHAFLDEARRARNGVPLPSRPRASCFHVGGRGVQWVTSGCVARPTPR
eukprot:2032629-Lingulodinium_polyedra.AAC.1